jgi:DNA polymerase-3 subunit gamma/tau
MQLPVDQLDRIRTQAKLIGVANLIRSADLVANGLTAMRGATPPRLILELICGQMLLPAGDNSALAARVEKLERGQSAGPITTSAPVKSEEKIAPVKAETKPVETKPVEPKKVETKSVETKKVEVKEVEAKPSNHKPSGAADITALRRMWPQVIENVKGKRRLTWSLLATSAQIISVDDENLTIGIVNQGARDSFIRSESDLILSDAFEEVAGVRRKILATVDTSVSTTTMARSDEDPSDANMLSGADLLASKLGARVIKESD